MVFSVICTRNDAHCLTQQQSCPRPVGPRARSVDRGVRRLVVVLLRNELVFCSWRLLPCLPLDMQHLDPPIHRTVRPSCGHHRLHLATALRVPPREHPRTQYLLKQRTATFWVTHQTLLMTQTIGSTGQRRRPQPTRSGHGLAGRRQSVS